jgi:hypothetical protein
LSEEKNNIEEQEEEVSVEAAEAEAEAAPSEPTCEENSKRLKTNT